MYDKIHLKLCRRQKESVLEPPGVGDMLKTGFLAKVNVLTLLYGYEELQRNTTVILFFILDILLADIDSCGGKNSKKKKNTWSF